ncbi:hypothetical protein [Pseudoalteromonas tunicata]|jgi:hypothetical protein|uniref:Uncharacterized protein n=1 Tax=Pseudoalteromonas tunicata D2 TaxID=87626 RepID=A4C9G5_9GAMM|nr:hypothetical protein [Pseudoalteromonas tunicata]AXT29559.1 hypothetical protein D1819_01085 [Pseudoalteromonas tunicata]EAR29230.1 hypothetical protein PTD2_09299 [Pseudoalteromonas tunicata D2]MDP4982432.1 hypothetical protein [Pseudoalteromonas tunicata]
MFDINSLLNYLYNGQTISVCLAFILLYFIRDSKGAFFSLITAVFFLYGSLTQSLVYEYDIDFIYRYIFWSINDLIWMGCIAYFAIKDRLYLWQSIIGQLVVVLSPILQIFRLLDRHLWDLSYSDAIYKTTLPLINLAVVVICFLPLFLVLSSRIKSNKQLAN